jgi:hypothetical protein
MSAIRIRPEVRERGWNGRSTVTNMGYSDAGGVGLIAEGRRIRHRSAASREGAPLIRPISERESSRTRARKEGELEGEGACD